MNISNISLQMINSYASGTVIQTPVSKCLPETRESKQNISPAGQKAKIDSTLPPTPLHPLHLLKALVSCTQQCSLAPHLGPALNFHCPSHHYRSPPSHRTANTVTMAFQSTFYTISILCNKGKPLKATYVEVAKATLGWEAEFADASPLK